MYVCAVCPVWLYSSPVDCAVLISAQDDVRTSVHRHCHSTDLWWSCCQQRDDEWTAEESTSVCSVLCVLHSMSTVYSSVCRVCSIICTSYNNVLEWLRTVFSNVCTLVHMSVWYATIYVSTYVRTLNHSVRTYVHTYVQYTAMYMYVVCSIQHVQDDHLTYVDQKFLIIRIRTHSASYSVCDVLVPNKSGLSSQWSPR